MISKKSIVAVVILTILMSLLRYTRPSLASSEGPVSSSDDLELVAMPEPGLLVNYVEAGKIGCREATQDEASVLTRRDSEVALTEITPLVSDEPGTQSTGLNITLRGTPQLDNYPQAKQAFLRAAAAWQSIIQNPISIIVDVDFGPTRFGEPYPEGLLGSSGFQNTGSTSLYPSVREKLIAGAASLEKRALFNSLPTGVVPTELGPTSAVFGPSTMFRALGLLNPVANPDQEKSLGPPPSIGFNSSYKYDFDPSDGIDSDKVDFEALAEHEIGHVLGFFSMASNREMFPTAPVGVSVWDLCRFRPGITSAAFPSAPRVLMSGGQQVFFDGGPELQLSTGRWDYTGGDGQQVHHWKANEFSGRYIGIMDPTLGYGESMPITPNDLEALETMGYRVARGDSTPVIRSLSASLDGDVLSLTGTASDAEGDIAQAQVKLLNGGGLVVAQTATFPVDFGTSTEVSFQLTITNLSKFPTAVEAMLTLSDSQGKTSKNASARFNQADPGGPQLSSVSISGNRIKIKGQGLIGNLAIEINGMVVSEMFHEAGKKITVRGTFSDLNLRTGWNRVRVRNGSLWSNCYLVEL